MPLLDFFLNFFRKIYLVVLCKKPSYSIEKESPFLFLNAFWDTLKITFSSCFFSFVLGLSLGIYLYLLRLNNNKKKYFFFNGIINVFISIPFLLLIILITSYTLTLKSYLNIYYGFKAGLTCLTLILTVVFARNCEQIFLQLNPELYKTAYTLGANKKQFIVFFLLKEAQSPLILKLNSLFVSSLAYSNVLHLIGVESIFSVSYYDGYLGHYNITNQEINNFDLIWVPAFLIFLLVQIINLICNYIAKKIDKN